jgi:hypothetical protein
MHVKSWIACLAICVLQQSTGVLGANDTSTNSSAIINVNDFPKDALETSAWAIIVRRLIPHQLVIPTPK